jgi:hypothetical protein
MTEKFTANALDSYLCGARFESWQGHKTLVVLLLSLSGKCQDTGIRSWLHLYTSIPSHYSIIILSFDASLRLWDRCKINHKKKTHAQAPWPLVRERTIPTDRPKKTHSHPKIFCHLWTPRVYYRINTSPSLIYMASCSGLGRPWRRY